MEPSESYKSLSYNQKTQEKYLVDTGDVLQPTRVRRAICNCDELDRIVLDNRPYLLFHVGILFWLILYFTQKR